MSEEYLKLVEQNKKNKERCKEYYYKNRETQLQKKAELRETEEHKKRMEKYRQSEAGKKSARISCWKQLGVITNDYDALYTKWKDTTHCEECNIELIEGNEGKHKKTLDHDHNTGQFRNIICNRCNTNRGNQDRGVERQTNEMYNENRKWKRWINKFKLKWAFKNFINYFLIH
jgi:hypothetical protein